MMNCATLVKHCASPVMHWWCTVCHHLFFPIWEISKCRKNSFQLVLKQFSIFASVMTYASPVTYGASLPGKTKRRFWAKFHLFSAHFLPIFHLFPPIFRLCSDYFLPIFRLTFRPIFRRSCLAAVMSHSAPSVQPNVGSPQRSQT